MARAIVVRMIEYAPSRPNAKCCRLDISKIKSIEIWRGPEARSVIYLAKGGHRFSADNVLDLARAMEEAKNG